MTTAAVASASTRLVEFWTSFRDGAVPDDVWRLARDCVIDTVAAAIAGHESPLAPGVRRFLQARPGGPAAVLGTALRCTAEDAAFGNAMLAHALELDSLRQPGVGVHPGAVLVPSALALAQELGRSGRDVLRAIIAGSEVLFRVGHATRESAQGVHGPGLTGAIGSAMVAGLLLGLDAPTLTTALALAGSMSAGLHESPATEQCDRVRRMHLGRAAAAGIAAARLAEAGLTGPAGALDQGFMHAFNGDADSGVLAEGLGTEWELRKICFRSFACHITAHTPIHAVLRLAGEHGFVAADVAAIAVVGAPSMAALHADTEPDDLAAAQRSIAFCTAAALLRDPGTVECFLAGLGDPAVRDLCRRVSVSGTGGFPSAWASRTTVRLRDGRVVSAEVDDFPGTPALPFVPEQMRAKFMALSGGRLGRAAEGLHARLTTIGGEQDLAWLGSACVVV